MLGKEKRGRKKQHKIKNYKYYTIKLSIEY